jgi:hypothetical protein
VGALGKNKERARVVSSLTAQTITTINNRPETAGGGTSKATTLIRSMTSITCPNHFT